MCWPLCLIFLCADGRRAVHGSGVAGVDANGEPAEMLSRFRDSDADCLRADGVPARFDLVARHAISYKVSTSTIGNVIVLQ